MASRKLLVDLESGMSEQDAHALVDALQRLEGVTATVRRLMVGTKNDQPTEWFIVTVPARHTAIAERAYRWWKAGWVHQRIAERQNYKGGTYADAAHDLGYLEVMPNA